ncbi:MAG TPA: lycopene beta-cyclase CrtY [Candidatus Krumholzibacteria bacterium]
MIDVLLVGGGLANGLIALRLKRARPDRRVVLIESSDRVGGNKTWSFHEGDVSAEQRTWLAPLIAYSWPGYRVLFPRRERRLGHPYFSILSNALHEAVSDALSVDLLLGREVAQIEPDRVELTDGHALEAACVIDGRGLSSPLPFCAAYQKFFGMSLTFSDPISVAEPILMDATVPQQDGFRFVYTLPWSSHTALVEDTYYSSSAVLDQDRARKACLAYVTQRGWSVASVDREEAGVLPIPLDGEFETLRSRWPAGVPAVGTRAGLFHPTTGYSLPDAVMTADALVDLDPLDTRHALGLLETLARQTWQERGYFRLLNRLMFEAADSPLRYKVLQHFYGMPDGLIRRFYAAQLEKLDQVRILSGWPPVPISRAVAVLARSSWSRRPA